MKNKALISIAALMMAMSAQAADIETDRNWYVAGEQMKVNVTADNTLMAYAELCDTYGLAAGAVVNLNGGKGTATIELPQSLHSGYYVLSVYTRNKPNVQNKLVAVVNPLKKSADDNMEWVEDTRCYPAEEGTAELQSWKDRDVRETEGHIIKARVKNVQDGKTYKASEICPSLSIVGQQIHYFEGKMMNDTTAVFYTYGISGKQPLVLSALTSTDVALPIELISPFATLLPKQLPRLVFHYKRSEVEARSMDMQRHQLGMVTDIVPLGYNQTVMGTEPDLSYNLDEYRQFLTIREVLTEYVNCVSKRKVNGYSRLIVRKESAHFNTSLPTLVLIDGMPVFDTERLLNYDARRIHYINIYGGQYTFGNNVYNGILSFVSRSGQLTNYPVERNMQYLEYEFPQ